MPDGAVRCNCICNNDRDSDKVACGNISTINDEDDHIADDDDDDDDDNNGDGDDDNDWLVT